MDVRRLNELCRRLDELASILEIMECDPINANLHRESSNALSQALSEIERFRSDAEQHRETSNALKDALAEIERLRSSAAIQPAKSDNGLNNLPLASLAPDWFMKFLEHTQVLIGEKVLNKKGDAD
jgi:hypothetical protein